MAEPTTVTADIDLTVGKRRLQTRISIPVLPMSPARLLPLARALADVAAEAASEDVAQLGMPVSCRAGCGACCRQLVPVTHAEARRLHDLIGELPEPRQSTIRARFAAAQERLRAAGMLQELEDPATWDRAENPQPRALDYFYLGIPCPFLEEESCSIYEERPLVCREFMVVSPAEWCADPRPHNVRVVKLGFDTFRGLARTENPEPGRPVRWVPLILAPAWADAHPEPPPAHTGAHLVRRLLAELTGKDILATPAPQESAAPPPA